MTRVAVIGVGRMGLNHVRAANGFEIVGVADHNADALRSAAKSLNLPGKLLFDSAETMLVETKPDCVIIATTAPTHEKYVTAAAKFGCKYILCEKPMATSLVECDQMIAVCRENGVKLGINHQMRFMEQFRIPKQLMATKYGGLQSVSVTAGNFGMAMNGTHYFELFRYLTDETEFEVSSMLDEGEVPNPRGEEYSDVAGIITIRGTSSKQTLTINARIGQGHGLTTTYFGSYGFILVNELSCSIYEEIREQQFVDRASTFYALPSESKSRNYPPPDIVEITRSTLTALIEERDYPTGEQGRLAVASLAAAYRSNELGGQAVSTNEKALLPRIFPWA